MTTGNKGEKGQKGNDDDDDEDPEDKKVMAKLHANFMEQSEIVAQLFNFVQIIFQKAPETANAINSYPELEQMLTRGMLQTENPSLRK